MALISFNIMSDRAIAIKFVLMGPKRRHQTYFKQKKSFAVRTHVLTTNIFYYDLLNGDYIKSI